MLNWRKRRLLFFYCCARQRVGVDRYYQGDDEPVCLDCLKQRRQKAMTGGKWEEENCTTAVFTVNANTDSWTYVPGFERLHSIIQSPEGPGQTGPTVMDTR